MARLACAALVISTLSACTMPRTALVVGAATTIAGGAMMASIKPAQKTTCEGATVICPPDINYTLQSTANGFGYLISGTILATGLAVLLSGAVGLAQEHANES